MIGYYARYNWERVQKCTHKIYRAVGKLHNIIEKEFVLRGSFLVQRSEDCSICTMYV